MKKCVNRAVKFIRMHKIHQALCGFLLTTTFVFSQQVNHSNIAYNNLGTMGVHDEFFIAAGTHTYLQNGDLWLYSNFTNNKLLAHDPSNSISMMRFKGNVQQIVSGTGATHVYDLQIDNNTLVDAVELDADILVNNNAEFLDGIVGADDATFGTLTFNPLATTSMTSDDSYVDGPVKKIGNTAFTFPIGDDNGSLYQYRPASISAPSAITDEFVGQYFFVNSNGQYPHASKDETLTVINDQEYWSIERVAGNSPVSVTLSWDADTTPQSLVATPSDLTIAHWNGSRWVDQKTTASNIVVDAAAKTVTAVTPTEYGIFTLASSNNSSGIEIFNLITPNGDGFNDRFYISGLDSQIDVTVKIFNRWDVLLYERDAYGKNGEYFQGYSEGRGTISKGDPLPSGTYYYQINYKDANGREQTLTGYLYIQH